MDGLFSDSRRPFYNFGRRIELSRLPYEGLGNFVEERFENADRSITPEAVDVLLGLARQCLQTLYSPCGCGSG